MTHPAALQNSPLKAFFLTAGVVLTASDALANPPNQISKSVENIQASNKPGNVTVFSYSSKTGIAQLHRVGPTQVLRTIKAAAAIAKDGDTVEIEAGEYLGDVAVWTQNNLTIRGVGGKAVLLAAGQSAEGKAIWVIRGGQITVENIIFKGAKVPDKNGAGIRFEKGLLTIRNCEFLNNENGILTASGDAELTIENSEFGYNGFGDGRSHGIYVGPIKKLQVTGSYFHHNKEGHLLKSRAAENHIMYNRFTDESGGTASYEMEFPNGGLAYVVGNIVQQSATTQNSTMISYGAEGYRYAVNELYLSHNTIIDDRARGGIFLTVKPGSQKVFAINNLLVGTGELMGRPTTTLKRKAVDWAKRWLTDAPEPEVTAPTGSFVETNNLTTDWSPFAQASRFDYRVKTDSISKLKPVEVGDFNGYSLKLKREYVHPASSKPLAAPAIVIGALQSPAGGATRP